MESKMRRKLFHTIEIVGWLLVGIGVMVSFSFLDALISLSWRGIIEVTVRVVPLLMAGLALIAIAYLEKQVTSLQMHNKYLMLEVERLTKIHPDDMEINPKSGGLSL